MYNKFVSFKQNRGGRVVRWCWVNFQCRGVLLIRIRVGQGPAALAVGAGGVVRTFFFSSIISHFFLPRSLSQTKSNTWAANVKNSNVSKMIQANSLLLNCQMKSPCYLVTLSLESSDFQTFLKQYVILVPFGAFIIYKATYTTWLPFMLSFHTIFYV